MKMLVTVVSSLLVGLSLASSNFSPIHELQHFLTNKRRIFYSLGIAVTGYLLVFTGLVLSLVEWALQFDAQGFVMWSSLFSVAFGLALTGIFSVVIAKLMVPARVEYHESIFKDLNKQFGISDAFEALLTRLAENRGGEQAAEPAMSENIQREEKFAERRPEREPAFRETATADVLHH
jgi:hypothetical protein